MREVKPGESGEQVEGWRNGEGMGGGEGKVREWLEGGCGGMGGEGRKKGKGGKGKGRRREGKGMGGWRVEVGIGRGRGGEEL